MHLADHPAEAGTPFETRPTRTKLGYKISGKSNNPLGTDLSLIV